MTIKQSRSDKVAVDTFTITTHHVQVDLTDLLAQYDVTDRVVILLQTPSGRAKQVTLSPNFLVAPHHTDEDHFYPSNAI